MKYKIRYRNEILNKGNNVVDFRIKSISSLNKHSKVRKTNLSN